MEDILELLSIAPSDNMDEERHVPEMPAEGTEASGSQAQGDEDCLLSEAEYRFLLEDLYASWAEEQPQEEGPWPEDFLSTVPQDQTCTTREMEPSSSAMADASQLSGACTEREIGELGQSVWNSSSAWDVEGSCERPAGPQGSVVDRKREGPVVPETAFEVSGSQLGGEEDGVLSHEDFCPLRAGGSESLQEEGAQEEVCSLSSSMQQAPKLSRAGLGTSGTASADPLPAPLPSLEKQVEERREASAAGPSKTKRRQRIFFSPSQWQALTDCFKANPNPTRQEVEALVQQIDLPSSQIRKWFYRERWKYKKLSAQLQKGDGCEKPPSSQGSVLDRKKGGHEVPETAVEVSGSQLGGEGDGALSHEDFCPLRAGGSESLGGQGPEEESQCLSASMQQAPKLSAAGLGTSGTASADPLPAPLLSLENQVEERREASAAGPSKTKRRQRTRFSPFQWQALTDCFKANPNPTWQEVEALVQRLDLSNSQIRNWFRNQRRKYNQWFAHVLDGDDGANQEKLLGLAESWSLRSAAGAMIQCLLQQQEEVHLPSQQHLGTPPLFCHSHQQAIWRPGQVE